MIKKMLTLSYWLIGLHLLLGSAVLAALKTSGIGDGLGHCLHLLFGLPILPVMLLLGALGWVTGSVTVNVMILMLAGIGQWFVVSGLIVLLDEILLRLRVQAELFFVKHCENSWKCLNNLHNTRTL